MRTLLITLQRRQLVFPPRNFFQRVTPQAPLTKEHWRLMALVFLQSFNDCWLAELAADILSAVSYGHEHTTGNHRGRTRLLDSGR